MSSTRNLQIAVLAYATSTYAFTNFETEPTCVRDLSNGPPIPEMLPHICLFEEGAEDWSGFDCTDLPEECADDPEKKFTWALTKIYKESQGTDKFGASCGGLGNHLTRDVKFPECVFGEPVPETRVGDLIEVAVEARGVAERILSSNPTHCAAVLGLHLYDIYGTISRKRISEVAEHGLRFNPELKLDKNLFLWDAFTNNCNGPTHFNLEPTEETPEETEARLSAKDFEFSRQVFNTEECTVIRHYDGSSFAKPHPGGLLGCKAECMSEPNCNAFNMDLKFAITLKAPSCDLLSCPAGASKFDQFEHVSFARTERKQSRARSLRMRNKRSQDGL